MNTGTLKLIMFCFILSFLFPIFAYTFTNFGNPAQAQSYDISLDKDDLINAGIYLQDAVSRNVTFGAGHQEYSLLNKTVRVDWINSIIFGDIMRVYNQDAVSRLINSWTLPNFMYFIMSNGVKVGDMDFNNWTMVNYYDTDYNWTHFECPESGIEGLITPLPINQGNITEAVLNGTITVTLGKQLKSETNWSAGQFIDFYWTILMGTKDWGLPDFMNWVIRLISLMSVLSAVLLTKELFRL